jgi:hypothetical protein
MDHLVLDYEPIMFDPRSMLIERRKLLESVASLGDYRGAVVTRPTPVEEMDVEAPQSPVQRQRTLVLSPPGGTVVFRLFRLMKDDVVKRLSSSVEQLMDTVRASCPALLSDSCSERRATYIGNALYAYTRRMIANTLARDENGTRLRVCLQQLEELYLCWGLIPGPDKAVRLVEGAKNNYTHVDMYHTLLTDTYEVSRNPSTDKFYETCADTRPRGRQPRAVSNNPPNPLNQLKKDYIESLKSAPPVVFDESDGNCYLAHEATQPLASSQLTVDYYPLFFKCLDIVNGCVPRKDNHGWFTARLRTALRQLTPKQWPMHGLIQSLCNLQGVLERRKVCVRARPGKQYYCCYTGQRLKDGEEVWLLRLLVLCPDRHLVWVKKGNPPTGSKADHPQLRSSIRCYFMKTQASGLCSIFHREFEAEYREKFTPNTLMVRTRELPLNRRYVFNPLWRLMHRLHHYITHNYLTPVLKDATGETYQAFRTRMDPLFSQISLAPEELRYIVFTGLFGVNTLDDLSPIVQLQREMVSGLAQSVIDIVLDVLDTTLDFNSGGVTERQLTVYHSTFTLPLLGVSEKAQSLQNVIRPQLAMEAPLLWALLSHSDRRRAERRDGGPDSHEKTLRMERVQQSLCTHPFLLLALHDTLYKSCGQLEELALPEALSLLSDLSLTVRK